MIAELIHKVHNSETLAPIDACWMLNTHRISATVCVLDDAVLINPKMVDINDPHVVEDAVEDAVSDFRRFELLAVSLLNEI